MRRMKGQASLPKDALDPNVKHRMEVDNLKMRMMLISRTRKARDMAKNKIWWMVSIGNDRELDENIMKLKRMGNEWKSDSTCLESFAQYFLITHTCILWI